MKSVESNASRSRFPVIRHEQHTASPQRRLREANHDVRNDLPIMISSGEIGMEQTSIAPRSTSRVTESAVKISMVIEVRIVPTRPGRR